MQQLQCLRPNDQDVAAKVIDDEAIIINVANGVYYSLDKAGGLIWSLLQSRYSLDDIVAGVVGRYDVAEDEARADVERLARQLVEENLLVICDDAPARPETSPTEAADKLPYESPELNIYRDMANLLALDPPMPALRGAAWQPSPESAEGGHDG